MDDDALRLERQFPFAASLFLAVTLILIGVGAVQHDPEWFIGAILPFVLAISQWIIRPHETALRFGPESVSDELHEYEIPYAEIQGLSISGKTPDPREGKVRGGRLTIHAEDRNHEYPNLSQATTRRVYELLLLRIPESGSREVVAELQPRLNNDLQLFDDDLVLTYRARPSMPVSQTEIRSFLLAMILGGIVWLCIGLARGSNWTVAGVSTIVIALFCTLIVWLARKNENQLVPFRHLSGLIISPRGIALRQGQLKGELKWSEVRSITCGRAASGTFVTHHPTRAISIKVAGAEILIYDIYDRPLATIHRCMMKFWEAR